MEKKAYATNIMLDKFTIRWSMLDNFITSLELCIGLYLVYIFLFIFSPSFIIKTQLTCMHN